MRAGLPDVRFLDALVPPRPLEHVHNRFHVGRRDNGAEELSGQLVRPATEDRLRRTGREDDLRLLVYLEQDVRPAERHCDEEVALRLVSGIRSAEHTSELQSLMRISYAVFCLNKNNNLH